MFDKKLSKDMKLSTAKTMFQDAVDTDIKWQEEARESFAFRDGYQWTDEEKNILQEEMRPALTFNLTKSYIDLVMGMNEENRVKHTAMPVDSTDGFLCEVLNDVVDWLYDQYDFELEEDGAFESACICGRGFVAVDFVPNPKKFGEITVHIDDIPVHEIHFDPAARKRDLSDASYMFWDKWMSREDFKIRYPKVKEMDIDELAESGRSMGSWGALGVPSDIFDFSRSSREDTSDYDRSLDLNFYDRAKNMIRVVHMEYWQTFRRYFYIDPESKQFMEFASEDFKAVKKEYEAVYGEKFVYETMMDKRVKWLQFIGDKILFDDLSPMPFDGFSVVPMIAYRDVSKRSARHFGIVQLIKDPQMEVNKRWSQTLNMLNQQVQAGVFAESDAFVDDAQAMASMKSPGEVTWVNSGAIAQGKIKERALPDFPNAAMTMEEHSERIMKQITGINPDLLGQDRGRQEPGVVVRMRQKQGTILLKPLFRNYNIAKKQIFERLLSVIMGFMPDNQILRVLGEGERYAISPEGAIVDKEMELVAEVRDVRNLGYNVVSEEASSNATKRMLELSAMLEMSEKVPVDPMIIIDKMDISESEKQRWKQYVQNEQAAAAESQEQMIQMEMGVKEAELGIDQEKNALTKEGQLLEAIVSMMKINQMADQNEIKAQNNAMESINTNRQILADFLASLADTEAKAKAKATATGGGTDGKRK